MAQGLNSYTSRGSNSDAMAARRKADMETWTNMMKMINTTSPQAMLGYGIGRLLRGAYDHMIDRRAENAGNEHADNNGAFQGGAQMPPPTITMGGTSVDPAAVKAQPNAGDVVLQGGMLGDGFTKTKYETTAPDGLKNSVTTTSPYTFGTGNSGNLADKAAALGAAMDKGYSFNPNMFDESLRKYGPYGLKTSVNLF